MHKCESGMCSVREYGSIVLGPRLRTFGMPPAMFAEQYSEHASNGHCSGRLIVIALTTVCINVTPECVLSSNMVV
jgi:hypothetical protein